MEEPRYKVLPDEEQPKRFRVVYFESEYTVSFKKELLHGLTKARANKMVILLEAKRESLIERMAAAITEWNEISPEPAEQAALISTLSAKYQIGKKSIETAIHMMIGGLNAEVKI